MEQFFAGASNDYTFQLLYNPNLKSKMTRTGQFSSEISSDDTLQDNENLGA